MPLGGRENLESRRIAIVGNGMDDFSQQTLASFMGPWETEQFAHGMTDGFGSFV